MQRLTLCLCLVLIASLVSAPTPANEQYQRYDYRSACIPTKNDACRPPQFITMAFDGGKSIDMWESTRVFAKQHNIQFTYFLSGAFLLKRQNDQTDHSDPLENKEWLNNIFSYKNYKAPGRRDSTSSRAGKSNIGFDHSIDRIRARYRQIVSAHIEGHEIASHAIGHFFGGARNRWNLTALDWTTDQWNSEFAQFNQFLTNGFDHLPAIMNPAITNNSQSSQSLSQVAYDIVSGIIGFRAPQLSVNSDLCGAMKKWGFKYDTSTFLPRHRWPEQVDGCSDIWNLSLPTIAVPGQTRQILAMDYNLHRNAVSLNDAVQAYVDYFASNYHGNRAPMHIGHHFSNYGGTINGDPKYWLVLKKFSQKVCHLPEVICTSYRNLHHFLETTPEDELDRFNQSRFTKVK